MSIDVRHLRQLRAIATHGSLTRAAAALGVGQPSLSESLRRLEEDLGTRLFYRHARGVEPTDAGALLVAHAEAVLPRLDALPGQLSALTDGLGGRFVLGCYHSLGAWYLPGVYQRLLDDLPDIDLQVRSARSAAVRAAVIDRECDLGLVVNAEPHPDLVITEVCRDAIAFVASARRLAAVPGLACLAAGPLFHQDREPFASLLAKLEARGQMPSRVIPLGDLELAKAIVARGVGVAALPLRVARYGGTDLQVVHPELPRFDDTIHLLMRYDTPRVRALRELRRVLVEVGRALLDDEPIG